MAGVGIQARVSAGLARAGVRTGSGAAHTGVIRRYGASDESSYPITPASTTDYTCTVVQVGNTKKDFENTNAGLLHVKFLVAPDVSVIPSNDDILVVGGKSYKIEEVETLKPGGVDLLYKIVAGLAEG